ncbi:MAG: alanine racemase, partial [Clostridia bacterium]|nr:alanine racemase [Clostridia bacterium]
MDILRIIKENLVRNVQIIKKVSGKPITFVAKDDCYGLSANNVLPCIDKHVSSYAVSTLKEARKLRALTTKPILIFTPPIFFDVKKEDKFIFTVSDEEDCKYLSSLPFRINAHLKINT